MNSLFRTCIYICILVIIFTLVINFVEGMGAFPMETSMGTEVDEDNALQSITGLSGGMEGIWLIATGIGAGVAVLLSWVSHSLTPIGVYLFSEVFWTSWVRMHSVFSSGGYIPSDLFVIFYVVVIFLFIGAVIGMITGSG